MSHSSVPVTCATCGKSIDALRAARVRFTESKQWYFCSSAHADEFGLERTVEPTQPTVQDAPITPVITPAPQTETTTIHGKAEESSMGGLLAASLPHSPLASSSLTPPQAARPVQGRTADTKLEAWLDWIPSALVFFGTAAGAALDQPIIEPLATFVLLVASHIWGIRTITTWRGERAQTANRYRSRLQVEGRRVTSSGTVQVTASELRAGEEVLIGPGEHAPADGQVASGQAQVQMWEGAEKTTALVEGDRIVGGALIVSGELRVICSKSGDDRAFTSLARSPEASIAEHVTPARLSWLVARAVAPTAGLFTAWALWLQGAHWAETLVGFGAIWGALSHPIARALPAASAARWLTWAAQQGICYCHQRLIDHAGGVSIAALCARGTVLHGEPEVAEVHSLRDLAEKELLSLAAGAESVVHHPVAAAVLRAARTRDIEVDNCRSHNSTPGMGVLCVSSGGDVLVLGSRELLLRERISIAVAEETLRALESRGLTALLLAKNNHLVGVIALQDSLRAGAKAAVQVLLDERIEPVLISGDSRATTEAVAHALAIEHVRPEIATAGRAREIQNLIEGGASVAVLGTTPRDDAALGAAPVPVVLDGASISWRDPHHGQERAIGLADKSVLAGALTLVAAKRVRTYGRRALALSLLPPAVATAVAMSRLAPLFFPIVVAGAGALLTIRFCLKKPNAPGSYY